MSVVFRSQIGRNSEFDPRNHLTDITIFRLQCRDGKHIFSDTGTLVDGGGSDLQLRSIGRMHDRDEGGKAYFLLRDTSALSAHVRDNIKVILRDPQEYDKADYQCVITIAS